VDNHVTVSKSSAVFRSRTDKNLGYAVEQLVEALSYKPEGHRFDYLWGQFSLT
jgi:hypothetical protein